MQRIIVKLVLESVKDSHYAKALECLQALREGCISENEIEDFNRFMADTKKNFKGKRRDDFWVRIVKSRISLITNEEHDDSEFSGDDARKVRLSIISNQSFAHF
jgi:ATP-dependent DNA helicase 2 subunit 2